MSVKLCAGASRRGMVGALSKYFDGGYSGHAICRTRGFRLPHRMRIHLDSKVTLRGEGDAPMPAKAPIKQSCMWKKSCAAITAG